jgi:TolA-binding protein
MNPKFKLALYAVLLAVAGWLVFRLTQTYRATEGAPATATGGVSAVTATNPPAATHAPADADEDAVARRPSKRLGQMTAYAVALFFTGVGVSLLVARDVSRFFAQRVDDFIFNDDLKGVHDPEYEEAEKTWAAGKHLDAIQLLRDYLKRHPREQYVALRIAEIYEKDLGNHLAAALEYEEILKKKLPAERWGWAAIHLANIYSGKLSKTAEAEKLLHRIVEEYSQTAAAKKARERLGIPEPAAEEPAPAPEPAKPAPIRVAMPQQEKVAEEKAPAPPASNLPPGFRPK